jgi:hypothetical protein
MLKCMHRSTRSSSPWLLTLALGLVAPFGLSACGVQEASAMTKFADQMCACTDVACADKVFTELEKVSKENEGKEVVAAAADKYNNEMDRAQKCYEKIHDAADKAAQ